MDGAMRLHFPFQSPPYIDWKMRLRGDEYWTLDWLDPT